MKKENNDPDSLSNMDGPWAKATKQGTKLYHATTNKILNVLEPRPCKAMNGEEGSFVFAAEDFIGAHAYALKTEDMLCIHYMQGVPNKSMHACVIKDREKFLNQGAIGTIYELPAEQFRRLYFDSGEASYEWVSEQPVTLAAEKSIAVTIEKAMAQGVQVFFASPDADENLVNEIYDPQGSNKKWEESGYYKAWKRGDLTWENHERGMSPFSKSEATLQQPKLDV